MSSRREWWPKLLKHVNFAANDMPKINFKNSKGLIKTVEAKIGWSVMETALENQIPGILGECGGGCSCATCHVYVDPDLHSKISTISEIEEETLDFVDNKVDGSSRLSCQIEVTELLEGATFNIPDD